MNTRRWRQRLLPLVVLSVIIIAALIWLHGPLVRALSFLQKPLSAGGTWVTDRALAWCEAALITGEDAAELIEQRNALAIERAELEKLRDENAVLRDQLGFLERRQWKGVAASVTQRSVGPNGSSFVIDRGVDDGIQKGNAVVVGDGMLVGKVTSTTATSATVTTLTDPGLATAITLLNGVRTIGLAQGVTGTLIAIEYIPNEETIRINDLVVTSGLEEGMPSGLLIGIVNDVQSDPTAPFQKAIVEPLADSRRFAIVSVLVTEGL